MNRSMLLAAMMLAAIPGCAADSNDDADDVGADDAALSRATVGESAVALEIKTVPMRDQNVQAATITVAGSKLAKVTRALKRRSPSEPVPRCMPGFRYDLRYLDATGKETSKGSVSCGGIGQLHVGDKTIPIRIGDALDEVASAPLVPGDALWGITKVTVRKPGVAGGTKDVTNPAEIGALVDAIDEEQQIVPIDPNAPVARCLPSFVVEYRRGTTEAASASFNCSSNARRVSATFSIGGTRAGTIQIETAPFRDVYGEP